LDRGRDRRIRPTPLAAGICSFEAAESRRRKNGLWDVRIDLVERLQELLAQGAQLLEVLPEEEYREEHLPEAINIPLKELDAESAGRLDQGKPVIVYCWDAL
jgi:hypothetical protein